MQALSVEHVEQQNVLAREFEAKMKTASTPEARRTAQLEFQQAQRALQEDFQRRMAALKAR